MLYYTGAQGHNKPQPEPALSLGNRVSSNMIPNGGIDNLFPSIDKEDLQNLKSEIRLIVLKPTMSMTSLRIWTESSSICTYKIAAVAAALDNLGLPVFEEVPNGNCIPYQATLLQQEGEANALFIGDLLAGSYLGIWIQRDLNLDGFTELDGKPGIENLTDDQLQALLEAATTATEENSRLIIDWI